MADPLRFLLNGEPMAIGEIDARTTVLDWLRSHPALRGTKEGCAEGDCGACTINIESLDGEGNLVRRAAVSCIMVMAQLEGLGLRTIEGIGDVDALHPFQTAMAEGGGTQCGYCTPGFIMSGVALLSSAKNGLTDDVIHDALAGNLCRCTGYRSIVDAVRASAGQNHETDGQELIGNLVALRKNGVPPDSGVHVSRPRTLAELVAFRRAKPQAALLAGGTDLGLLAGRDRTPPDEIILTRNVAELRVLEPSPEGLRIGAAITYAEAAEELETLHPEIARLVSRIGSTQIRTMGTIGGNLGTASPVGDMIPMLIALDARVTLATGEASRTLPVEDFVQGYRKTSLREDEFIVAVDIPALGPDMLFFAEKVSRRRDQDISTLMLAARLSVSNGIVTQARLAFGGMADRVKRATHAETALTGKSLALDIDAAIAALCADFTPIADVRASASYRNRVAGNLLRKMAQSLEAESVA